jgi:hypothetical protein
LRHGPVTALADHVNGELVARSHDGPRGAADLAQGQV